MIESVERRGEVIGFKQGLAQIRIERAPSACGGCGSRGTCASGNAAVQSVEMAMPAGTRIGDQVTVSMPSSSVALAAILGYLLPPLFLLLGAIGADVAYGSDLAAVLGAAGGLVFGLLLARLVSHFTLGSGISSSACTPDLPSDSPYGEHP
ncbi:MAG: SoxR reducing system RseC family protein [Betaproteobacteria bacterium]